MNPTSDAAIRGPVSEAFRISENGLLIRSVLPRSGRSYEHVCRLGDFKVVLHTIEDRAELGVTCDELWAALPEVPMTPVAVALAFLKERGCLVTRRRRNYPASNALFEDGLCEWYALHVNARDA